MVVFAVVVVVVVENVVVLSSESYQWSLVPVLLAVAVAVARAPVAMGGSRKNVFPFCQTVLKVCSSTIIRWLLGLNGDGSFMPTSPHRLAAVIHEPSRCRWLSLTGLKVPACGLKPGNMSCACLNWLQTCERRSCKKSDSPGLA